MKANAIWGLAFPIILSNITIPLLGAVDVAVMGHMETAAYVGAVAIGALLFDYIYWGFGFLRLSTTGLSAQALGREDATEVRSIFARASLIAVIGALLLWVLQPLIFALAARVIDASGEVERLAEIYFEIRIWSAPAALMNYVIIGWILAHKDTKSVLIQQVITNGANVVLSLWFVVGLDMEVAGVAWSTVAAQYIGLSVGVWMVRTKLLGNHGVWDWAVIKQASELKKLIAMNADLFVRTVCLLTAFAWFTAQGAKLGDVTLAANAILLQFQQFTAYALDGFAHAVEILSGHAAGKKSRSEFNKAMRLSTWMALATACVFSLFYLAFGPQLILVFTDIAEVIESADSYLIWMIALPIISVWSFQFDGIYFGLTQTKILRNMMVLCLLVYLPLSLLALEYWGNHGLWAAFCIFMGLRGITLYARLGGALQKVF